MVTGTDPRYWLGADDATMATALAVIEDMTRKDDDG